MKPEISIADKTLFGLHPGIVSTCLAAICLASALALAGCSAQSTPNAGSQSTDTATSAPDSTTASTSASTSTANASQATSSQNASAQPAAAAGDGSTVFPADQEAVSASELDDAIKSQQTTDDVAFLEVIDVRKTVDYINTHVPNSLNTPLRQIKQGLRLNQITTTGTVVIVATDNTEAEEARQVLIDSGYDASLVKILDGGWQSWVDAGLKIDNGQKIGC